MSDNLQVAEAHIHRIVGPTILMGDGSYFDYESPETSTMTIEDYAWGICGTNRFRCQTRVRATNARCFYNVGQHVYLGAMQMLEDGYPDSDCFDFLMHESGEVVWGDMPGPCKGMIPDFKPLEKRSDSAIGHLFGVTMRDPVLIKKYDLRMLATEKRDLMPQGSNDAWQWIKGYEPFDFTIEPWSGERAVEMFLGAYRELRP